MKSIKKLHFLIAAWFLLAALLTACAPPNGSSRQEPTEPTGERQKMRVVTTLFPYYDFARQIAGDKIDLTLVVPAGMDSHSFEPTPADMRIIQTADILISNGGTMEHWLNEVLGSIDTTNMTVVTLMDHIDAVEEEHVEGMEEEQESYIDHDGHEVEIEYDEHIWTSPVNAMKLVTVIRDTLQQADPANAGAYEKNTEAYLEELSQIDAGFREVSEARLRNVIVVGDKFPFRYFADEYRLDYRAAFSGCSADTEPSAKTIAYLIDKVRDEKIPVVYYLELSSPRVAEIISEETGAEPLLLHSCHNVTRAQFDSGVTYGDLMRQNIENLRKGLDE